MTDLVERLRIFEGSDALGDGDFAVCTDAALLIEAQQQRIERLEAALQAALKESSK